MLYLTVAEFHKPFPLMDIGLSALFCSYKTVLHYNFELKRMSMASRGGLEAGVGQNELLLSVGQASLGSDGLCASLPCKLGEAEQLHERATFCGLPLDWQFSMVWSHCMTVSQVLHGSGEHLPKGTHLSSSEENMSVEEHWVWVTGTWLSLSSAFYLCVH